jgi:hypothetical protein
MEEIVLYVKFLESVTMGLSRKSRRLVVENRPLIVSYVMRMLPNRPKISDLGTMFSTSRTLK